MSADPLFESALAALLDGEPLPESAPGDPASSPLVVLHAIAAAHERLFARQPVADTLRPQGSWTWGSLEVHESVGRGASATVYRAWDPGLGRDVALKLFDSDAVNAEDAQREGRLLAGHSHDHMVKVYGVAIHDNTPGLWMEFVRGRTVDATIAASGPWTVDAALIAGRDLAGALAALHARHCVHGDVKARNVVREPGGRIVLMDLGAGVNRNAHREVDLRGTPLYMAPELFEGGMADDRTDIYSLGVLLFHMLSRSYPVVASSFEALVEAHRRHERKRLAETCPSVPRPVAELIDRLCAHDPDERPESAREAERALGEALATFNADAHPVPSRAARIWSRVKRPVASVAGATMLAAVTVVSAWDTAVVRDLRWAAGAGAPAGCLVATAQGEIALVGGRRVAHLAVNPVAAFPLAVSSRSDVVTTMGGTPPFEQGGLRVPLSGVRAEALGPAETVCCFTDGTTDGVFNYAVRQHETRAPGTNPQAPATLYRFNTNWSGGTALFEIDSKPVCNGVAFLPRDDTFAVTCNSESASEARLEVWSRSGRRTATLSRHPGQFFGVAYDPADNTLWVVLDQAGVRQFLVYAQDGRFLGRVPIPAPFVSITGIEFPLPDPEPWASRTLRRAGTALRWWTK